MLMDYLAKKDKEFEEAMFNPNEKHPFWKGFKTGAINGACTGLVIVGAMTLAILAGNAIIEHMSDRK